MSVHFDLHKRIYDLYSFDAPYDLEPRGFSGFTQDYRKDLDLQNNSALADTEDDEDILAGLDLTLEEAEHDHRFATSGFDMIPDRNQTDSKKAGPSPVLGATLSQRKKLLKERIEELVSDIHNREKLEEQMLEKADVETEGLEFLLGQVRTWGLGNYPSVDMRRTNLEREILTLKKAGWDEMLRCWRDVVMLKRELRETLEEYHLILAAEG
jgi:hypothetical protein